MVVPRNKKLWLNSARPRRAAEALHAARTVGLARFRSACGCSLRVPLASRQCDTGKMPVAPRHANLTIALVLMLAAGMVCGWLGTSATALAQETTEAESYSDETPLYEEDPYDRITLTKQYKERLLKVEPLKLPGRRLPRYPRPSFRLEVRLWDTPEKPYELRWSSIEKVELFEQIVLAKAVELVKQGEREKAYDYFQWLETKHPDLPGLKEAIGDYLYGEAAAQRDKGDYFGALAMLVTLYEHNPGYPKLADAFGAIEDKLLRQYDAARKYSAARRLLWDLRRRFDDHPTAVNWELELQRRAAGHLAEARRALAVGNFRRADRAMQEVVLIWPDLPGAREMVASLHREYPRVVVGVGSRAVSVDPRHRQDWSTRRSSRLIYRTLTEFLGPGSEGGDYRCPVGVIEIEPLARRLVIQIHPNLRWAQGNLTLTGVDVARRLLAMATPGSSRYRAAWSELFAGATVRDVYQVDVEMRRPHVRPDALLQTTLVPYTGTSARSSSEPTNGPYVIDKQSEDETIYVFNRRYFAAVPTQPREIVERHVRDDREAIQALGDGQIKVLDRVNPWRLAEFRSLKNVVVRPYAAPLVHCLIPNRKRPLMDEEIFRRALVYGIHRQGILNDLLGKKTVERCHVISGPFPRGDDYDDPLGYAYDVSIEPRPYEPALAIMLANVAVDMVAAAELRRSGETAEQKTPPKDPPAGKDDQSSKQKKPKKKKVDRKTITRITVAHPPEAIARVACGHIKEQLKKIGIEVVLKELPPGPIDRVPDDVDLLYAELPIWEPVVDSRALLAADGPARGASAYMTLVLRQLRHATDWRAVRPILRRIHRIAHDDVAVVPLWQLLDHYACHVSVQGIAEEDGSRPVSLYENVEQWKLKIAPEASSETR